MQTTKSKSDGGGRVKLTKEERASRARIDAMLKTMRRIPKEEVLDLATREFNMFDYNSCFVGWVVRDGIAKLLNGGTTPDVVNAVDYAPEFGYEKSVTERAAYLYGGTQREWERIYFGVIRDETDPDTLEEDSSDATLREVEIAFSNRLGEVVRTATRKRAKKAA